MSCLTKESEVTRMLLAEKLKKAMGLTKPRGGGGGELVQNQIVKKVIESIAQTQYPFVKVHQFEISLKFSKLLKNAIEI